MDESLSSRSLGLRLEPHRHREWAYGGIVLVVVVEWCAVYIR